MSSLDTFQQFVDLTGTSVVQARDAYNRLVTQANRRIGIIYPTTTADLRASTDRFTLDRICRYCESKAEYGHQCRNCGARA